MLSLPVAAALVASFGIGVLAKDRAWIATLAVLALVTLKTR